MKSASADRLMRDLHAVAADMDELIESIGDGATDAIAKARERVVASLETAKQSLKCAGPRPSEEANAAGQSQGAYFRVNAWKAIGVAAGIGLLLGAIAGMKGGLSRAEHGSRNPK